jgi:hypothetical protein
MGLEALRDVTDFCYYAGVVLALITAGLTWVAEDPGVPMKERLSSWFVVVPAMGLFVCMIVGYGSCIMGGLHIGQGFCLVRAGRRSSIYLDPVQDFVAIQLVLVLAWILSLTMLVFLGGAIVRKIQALRDQRGDAV